MVLQNLDDGNKLEAAWNDALKAALSYFRALHASASSSAWRPVQVLPLTASSVAHDTGLSRSSGSSLSKITANEVIVHRRSGRTGEVYRAVVDVDCGEDVGVDTFGGCLITPETRPSWDRMIEEAQILELLDAQTRVVKTDYRLGWPSNPRDAVTISRTLVDQQTIIDISTSLPRSKHEPAYLRPAPPHVRAYITLLAWCIQLGGSPDIPVGRARITCYWSWNPKGAWAVGGGVPQHMPSMMVGLVDYVREGSEKVPVLLGYGQDVSIGGLTYDTSRVTLSVGYAIVNARLESDEGTGPRRQIEFGLSWTQSWDVQITVKTQNGEESPSIGWSSFVGRAPALSPGSPPPRRLVMRFAHAALTADEELVRVTVSIERTSSNSPGVRINGVPVVVEPMPQRPSARPLLEETGSTSAVSLRTISTNESVPSQRQILQGKKGTIRSPSAERGISSLIRRNYIYFTSLLQEPEAKWRPVLDSRGVAIHQLDSIDKTLVVFRAEAVFVGVGIWDLFATIASPGGRVVWDKTGENAALLEDVNELTDLWHFQSKAAWPVAARDSILLRTTYKSPSSVHIFGFSVDNADLFPQIPPNIDPAVIRTQIDLQGWSIESLSPNTTQVTLLEQSDPRGWSNKSSIPQVMMASLAGIGESSIKHGAPPIATRLGGAKAISSRYDVEKETYRFEYEAAEARRSSSSSTSTAFPLPVAVRLNGDGDDKSTKSLEIPSKLISNVECEIRCDAESWASSFSVMVDPPQVAISALKRHRLSPLGGGLWLTIEHDPVALGDSRVAVTVRKGTPGNSNKTIVTVNGHKIKTDSQDLSEAEVNLLKKQKRLRPNRAPLDQPPALGTLRKKQSQLEITTPPRKSINGVSNSPYSRFSSPLKAMYTYAAESTKAAIIPMAASPPASSASDGPVDAAIRALGQLTRIHSDRDGESTDPFGWQPVSEKDGLKIEKRIVNHVSDTFPVFRAGRIIEGFTAEEISACISVARKNESFDRPEILQSYGNGITVSHLTAYTAFPFRQRSILVANIVARLPEGIPPSPTTERPTSLSTILHASSSSFDASTLDLDPPKYNPASLTTGRLLLSGWILETIDPYSHEQYAIPSTRCMYVAAVDFSGNIPFSVNNLLNGSLPRALLSIEANLKAGGPPSRSRLPCMCVSAPDATATGPWALENGHGQHNGVMESNDDVKYGLTVILQPTTTQADDFFLSPTSPTLRHAESKLSVTSGRTSIVDLGEEIRRGKKDLVVCEIDIGRAFIKSGCNIDIIGVSLPIAQNALGNDSPTLPFALPPEVLDLPFEVTIVTLPPSALQSASLDPDPQPRHLLKVTLPTSGYEGRVDDPLSSRTPPLPRPRWLLDLLNDGAVAEIQMMPREDKRSGYRFAAQDVTVTEMKASASQLATIRHRAPKLVNRSTPECSSLERPIAVARPFLKDPSATETPQVLLDGIAEETSTLGGGDDKEAPIKEAREPTPEPPRHTPPKSDKKLSFWKYGRLPSFTMSTPVSLASSPVKTNGTTASLEKDQAGGDMLTIDTEHILRPIVSLPALVLACIVCLLLGSLLRSLLSEADFVISPNVLTPSSTPSGQPWRELRQLFSCAIGWKRDLVIAIAKRR